MLEKLRKALGGEPTKPAETLEVKLDTAEIQVAIEAAVNEVRVEFDAYKQSADAAMAEAADKVTALQAELAEMAGKLAAAQAALDAADEEAMKAAAEAAALKLAARNDRVIAALGTERAAAVMKATEGMDDAAFEAVVTALGVGAAAEAAAPLFNEVGVDAQADAGKVVEESKEMKLLKAKYQPQGKK